MSKVVENRTEVHWVSVDEESTSFILEKNFKNMHSDINKTTPEQLDESKWPSG